MLVDDESEAEVFGVGGSDSEPDDESDDDDEEAASDDDEIFERRQGDDLEEEEKTWGQSRDVYYDADEADDLDEMREEEEEALRIQKERLAALEEADFMDDATAWGVGAAEVQDLACF